MSDKGVPDKEFVPAAMLKEGDRVIRRGKTWEINQIIQASTRELVMASTAGDGEQVEFITQPYTEWRVA